MMSFLKSLCEELRADMAGAVETLTAGRTPGRLASPSAGMGRSGNRVVTGGGGCDDGGTGREYQWGLSPGPSVAPEPAQPSASSPAVFLESLILP